MAKEKKLEEINTRAAFNISTALSKLFSKSVEVNILKADIVKSLIPIPDFNLNSSVAGVYLPLSGDVEGAAIIVFPEENAIILSDLLLKKEPGISKKLDELGESTLSEVGNIITGSYFTVIADMMHAKIIEHTPQFKLQKFSELLREVATKFVEKFGMVVAIEMELLFALKTMKVYLVFLLEQGKISDKLKLFSMSGTV